MCRQARSTSAARGIDCQLFFRLFLFLGSATGRQTKPPKQKKNYLTTATAAARDDYDASLPSSSRQGLTTWSSARGAPSGDSSSSPCVPRMRRYSAAVQRLGFAAPSSGAAVFLSCSVRDSSTTAPNRFGVS
jgi:hypothetical protein